MRNIFLFSFLVVAASIFTSCNDEFLDRFPETQIGRENFFNTEEDLFIYVNNLYTFPNGGMYTADGYSTTDNCANTGSTELKTIMTTSPSSNTIQGGWNWGRLRTINFFLDNFDKADVADDVKAHYEGVARYFRARYYMGMVKRYSDVPWYDQVIETGDEEALFKDRDPRTFVVDRIFEDIQFAAENVFADQPEGAVNQMLVKSELARMALYEGTYRKYHDELNLQNTADSYIQLAKTTAEEIINSGEFNIYNTGNPESDYYDLFVSGDLTSNPEVIFTNISVDNLKNSGNSTIIFGNFETCPSKDLLQSYLMADGSFYTEQEGYQTKTFVEEFENRDPRLSQTYAAPGFILYRVETYAQGEAGEPYIQQLNKNFSGYHQVKGWVNSTDPAVIREVDYPIIRYAEILLIYAEARAELEELTQADLDLTINELRARVNMPAMTIGPKVDPVQQARYPGIEASTSQWAELLEIRRERRVELAMEGYRFDDIMRWKAGKLLEQVPQGLYFSDLGKYDLTGDGVEDIILIDVSETIPAGSNKEVNELGKQLIYYRASLPDGDGGVYLENGTSGNVQTINERGTFIEPKYYYRPIPSTQVIINPNLTQNFGWE